MIRKFKKSIFVVLLLFVVSLFSGISAAACDITVKFGGSEITLADMRVGDDSRTYVPYQVFFRAMGIPSSYDAASQMVTAVNGDLKIEFYLDEDLMTVTTGTSTQTVFIDAYPFMDGGTVYIPVRYAAQALGYAVGWDSASQAVTLESVESIIAHSGATYMLMDRALASQMALYTQKSAISGSFSLDLMMPMDEETPVPLNLDGTISGLLYQQDAEMTVKMQSNMSEFVAYMDSAGELDPMTGLLLANLDDFELNLIMNSEAGMLYIGSPFLSALAGKDSDVWMSMDMDMSDLTSDMPLSFMTGDMENISTFSAYISTTLKDLCLYDFDASELQEVLDMFNMVYSDQAFVKQGDNYVGVIDLEALSGYEMSVDSDITLTLKFSGDTYKGMAVDAEYGDGTESLSMNFVVDETGSGSMAMSLDIMSMITLDMSASLTSTSTSQSPASEPPAGSTILPMDDMMYGLYWY